MIMMITIILTINSMIGLGFFAPPSINPGNPVEGPPAPPPSPAMRLMMK